ncbi:MAG TPA: hypothetical protein VNP20_00195 [Nocardioidaceae bacterium]|nr:hypothetical protein [Nocardioidaceae bacterium]
MTVPAAVAEQLRGHLDEFVGEDPDAWLFTGVKGGPLRRSNFNKSVRWGRSWPRWG